MCCALTRSDKGITPLKSSLISHLIEKHGSVRVLNRSYCSFNMTLRCVTLASCSLHNQVSCTTRVDSLQQVLNRLLCVGLHFHPCISSGFQPLSHPFCSKTRTATYLSARSAASCEDTLGKSIVALEKLSLKHDQFMRELAGALTDFWLAPKSLKAVTAGLEAGADHVEEVKKRGRGHGRGAPYTHVAAAFVDSLTAETEGRGQGGLLSRENAGNPAQGQGGDDIQRAGGDQERGRGRNAGQRARGKGRATSHRPNVESERSREGSGRRTEERAGSSGRQKAARLAECSAEVVAHRGQAQCLRAASSCVETSKPRMRQP